MSERCAAGHTDGYFPRLAKFCTECDPDGVAERQANCAHPSWFSIDTAPPLLTCTECGLERGGLASLTT